MAKPLSGSTAPSLGTRSRTWPYEARTVKSLPRYLLIVLALAGDSTMRRFLAMGESGSGRSPGATGRTPNDSREGNARGWATGVEGGFSFFSGITRRPRLSSRGRSDPQSGGSAPRGPSASHRGQAGDDHRDQGDVGENPHRPDDQGDDGDGAQFLALALRVGGIGPFVDDKGAADHVVQRPLAVGEGRHEVADEKHDAAEQVGEVATEATPEGDALPVLVGDLDAHGQ